MLSVISFAQDPVITLNVDTKDDDTGKKLGGVTVEVYKNGKLFTTKVSAANGKVPTIELPVGEGVQYTVYLKKPGYVTKMANIDAHYDYPEDLPPILPWEFQTSLFQSVDGVDFSFLETTPMVKFFVADGGWQEYDKKYTKDMLERIEKLKEEIAEKKEEEEKKEADFLAYVEAGDNAVKKEDFSTAIEQYDLALAIKNDAEVQTKKANAQKALDEMNAAAQKEKDFSAKMEAAKKALDSNNLNEALTLYKEASNIKPDEKLPLERIAEIEETIANQKAEEENFKNLVALGDNALGAENFDEAISKYEEALKIKSDSGVQQKLENAKKAKSDKEAAAEAAEKLEADYKKAMDEANKAFDTKDYATAKEKYNEALALKSNEQEPKDQIAKIDKILADEKAAKEAADKLEADYQKLIQEANALFDKKDWANAKIKYQEALAIKNNEKHPLDRIDLINKNIADEEIAAAETEKYNAAMAEAQKLFDQKKYDAAISKYEEASGIKPTEQEPNDQITKIQKIKADEENAAQLEADFEKYMAEGKTLKGNKDYTAAITSFNKALEIKPSNGEAKKEIEAINAIIAAEQEAAEKEAKFNELIKKAEEAYNAQDYTTAKLNYQKALEVKDDPTIPPKISEIDAIIAKEADAAETQKKYDAKMAEANALYTSNDNKAALEKYEEASAIKPTEQEPKDKIIELKEKIANAEDAAALEADFQNLKKEGDDFYAANDLEKALEKYKAAIAVKPDPSISQKIAEINTKITEQNQNAATDEKYRKKMEDADAAFANNDWEVARDLYKGALDIKPNEQRPKDQIAQIEANMKKETESEAEAQYQKIIKKADLLLSEDKLDDAISYYNRALKIKPNDNYPQEQIAKIEQIKVDRANAASEKEKLEADYKALIDAADIAFNAQNFQTALTKYQEALILKPGEVYPTSQIDAINKALSELDEQAKLNQEYQAKIDAADEKFNAGEYQASIPLYNEAINIKSNEAYPKNQIAKAEEFMKKESENEIEEQYQKILTKAQEKLDAEEYQSALDLYLRAKTMKPTDPIPQQKIDQINAILSGQADADKKQADYDALIKEADYEFEKKNWKVAKEKYASALNLMDEQYPKDQIKKIEGFMKTETSTEIEEQYNKIIAKADEYFGSQNWEKAKGLYKRALNLKPYDQYPKDKLKEIEDILNPPKDAKSGYTLVDYGPPNRNTNSVDVELLLEDANEARQNQAHEEALQQRQEAADSEGEFSDSQTDENYEVVNTMEDLRDEQSEKVWESEVHRTEFEAEMVELDDNLAERDGTWKRMNENDVQHVKQAVTNMENEIAENNSENDQPREEYEDNVRNIEIELVSYENMNRSAQNAETGEAREFVEDYEENNVTTDPNNDNDRKNTEVYVEDLNITLINSQNEDAWTQEDKTILTKNETEIMVDERNSANAGLDNQRVEYLPEVDDINDELYTDERNNRNDQYDVISDTKTYTENLMDEIEMEKIGNDQPRLDTEDEVEDLNVSLIEERESNVTSQNNELFEADAELDNMEIEMQEDRIEQGKPREEYEKDVVSINEEIIETDNILKQNGDNATNNTEDQAHKLVDEQNDYRAEATQKQNDNTDKTHNAAEDIIDENSENLQENKAEMEETQDFLDNLKYEDPGHPKEKGVNKLGEDFPEGVTEEIYTLKGEDGLIATYIIRRIVVVNGYGNVYEKTKTHYGSVTYTKNGQPISETIWQDETEAAELVRN